MLDLYFQLGLAGSAECGSGCSLPGEGLASQHQDQEDIPPGCGACLPLRYLCWAECGGAWLCCLSTSQVRNAEHGGAWLWCLSTSQEPMMCLALVIVYLLGR